MTIAFTNLPMTELRTGPGAILDRVADGESFVIERNGRSMACLVPIANFLPDIPSSRIIRELEELEGAGESLRTTVTSGREIAFQIRQRDGHDRYHIMIVLPHTYPNACPRVYADPVDSRSPHRFADGALCIFGVMGSWNPAKHAARDALDYARAWLSHYEIWKRTGDWPRPEPARAR